MSVSFNRKSRGPPPATGVCRASRAQAVPPNRGQPPPVRRRSPQPATGEPARDRGGGAAAAAPASRWVAGAAGAASSGSCRARPAPPPATGPPRREEVAGPSLGQPPWRGSCGVRRPRRACYDRAWRRSSPPTAWPAWDGLGDLFRRRLVDPPVFILGVSARGANKSSIPPKHSLCANISDAS